MYTVTKIGNFMRVILVQWRRRECRRGKCAKTSDATEYRRRHTLQNCIRVA